MSTNFGTGALLEGTSHRAPSSSLLGLPYRILNINHKKELLRAYGISIRHGLGFGAQSTGLG